MLEDRTPRPSFPRRHLAPSRPATTQSTIRPVYAAVFDLDPAGYEDACARVLDWLRTHPTLQGHADSLSGTDFDFNHAVQSGLVAQAAHSPDGNVTVVRLQHRERDGQSGKLDRLRDWRTEATVAREGGHAWIATRQWFAGIAGDVRACKPPRFIKELWSAEALSDVEIFERTCRIAEFELDADDVADLINDPDRQLPVVVLADGCPLDCERVAADFIGLAHVVKVARTARLRLNDVLGLGFRLEHGSLQTFYPLFSGGSLVAPASRFETIIGWRFATFEGPAAFSQWLRGEIANAVVTRAVNDEHHKSFEEIRTKVIHAQRAVSAPHEKTYDSELLDLAEVEIADLRKEIAEATERAQMYLSQKSAAEEYARQEVQRNHKLQLDKIALQHALNDKTGAEPTVWNADSVERLISEQPVPETIFDAVEQAERLFLLYGSPVTISEEAKEGAMEALHFKRPADVQAALIRLGFLWKDIRSSGKRLDQAATEGIRFPCTMFESDTTMRNFGHQRKVCANGSTVILQKHIKLGGGGKDDAARVYFGDNKDGEVLIGHVGRHLDVAKTQ